MNTVYECGICWARYQPALGDGVAQVAAGTAFAALPDDWHCPICGAPKEKFLAAGDGTAGPRAQKAETVAAQVKAAYLSADESMRGLPVHNPNLGFDCVGFRSFDGAHVGVAVTPWCMVLLRIPFTRAADFAPGATATHSFPSGDFDFVTGELAAVGAVETASLFSPMQDFADPEAARAAAEAAIAALFTPPPRAEPKHASRRALLFGSAS